MTTADYAIIISFLSLGISTFVALWTVYKDAFRKPKFRVSVAVKHILQGNREIIGPYICVYALNLGPIPNRAVIVTLRHDFLGRMFRDNSMADTLHDPRHPAHTATGELTEVGNKVAFVFPIDSDFIESKFSQIGVIDGYGNTHWVSKKAYKKFMEDHKKVVSNLNGDNLGEG